MMKITLALLLLVVVALAKKDKNDGDVTIRGNFRAVESVAYWETVEITNNNDGENLTNAVREVSFTVRESTNQVSISYAQGSQTPVGTIVAGATGYGQFRVVVANSGSYNLAVTAKYKKGHSDDFQFETRVIVLKVFGDDIARSVEESLDRQAYEQRRVVANNFVARDEVHTFEDRQPGNDDADITPTSFVAQDSITTWNDFNIIAGDKNLNNVTFTVTPDDLSVLIGYPPEGNYIAQIMKNTTYSTDISVTGNPGLYNFNCSIRYRRAANPGFNTFWIVRLCYIDGDTTGTTSTVRLGAAKAPLNVDSNLIRADVALGVAVGGIALVAAVAVVSAMIVIRKRQEVTV